MYLLYLSNDWSSNIRHVRKFHITLSSSCDMFDSLNRLTLSQHTKTYTSSTHSCSSSVSLAETQTPVRRAWTFGSFLRSALVHMEQKGCYTPTSWWPLWSLHSLGTTLLPPGRGQGSLAARDPRPPRWGSGGSGCPGNRWNSAGQTDHLLLTWKEERQRH